jgi:hypothetical protein
MLLDKHGLRISHAMTEYLAKQAQSPDSDLIPVIGGDARTGIPLRAMIPLDSIRRAMES